MKRFLVCLLILCCLIPSALAEVYVGQKKPDDWDSRDLMRLTVFRTGESDCMLLEAGGEAMMIDGGADKYRESLRDALADRNLSHLKYIYSTHPHDDHINGLWRIMQYGVTADEFLCSFAQNYRYVDKGLGVDLQARTVRQAESSAIPFRQIMAGDQITLGDATLSFYQWYDGKTIDAQCPMTRVEFHDAVLLLTSDIIGETQHYFLKNLPAEVLKADVVKAPHHGLTGFVSEFLDAVDPGFIFITNYDNEKPKKTVNQAKYRKLPYKLTGSGTVIMETDGTDWYIEQLLKQF